MLKNRKVRFIAICLAVILALSGTVFAKQATETISVMYDNIKILIDGVEYTATDANGNVVEPFIYNGTTYLPVRGIANAFDKEVDWEPQTSTVVLGSKNYDWLDQMGYANYETSGNANNLVAWETGKKGCDGIMYDRGLMLKLWYDDDYGAKENNDGTYSSYQNIEYLLNNNYSSFEGKLLCEPNATNNQNVIVKIYGDGNLLYTSPPLTKGTKAVDFKVDVSNYKVLKINADIPNLVRNWSNATNLGIVDARLAKK